MIARRHLVKIGALRPCAARGVFRRCGRGGDWCIVTVDSRGTVHRSPRCHTHARRAARVFGLVMPHTSPEFRRVAG